MTQKEYKIQVKHYIDNIKKALDENYLSIFAGAGVSTVSNLPSYKKLMNTIKERLNTKEKDFKILAEIFYNQYGKNYYYQTLRQLIPFDSIPNELHIKIAKLNLKNLITTNWDNLFEKAIMDTGQYYDIISSDEDIAHNRGFSKLIKMHGSLDRENIIFTDSDYLSYSDKFPLVENYIKGVFSTDLVVIMGYSLGDENVKQIISWVNSNATNIKPIYFVKINKDFDFKEFEFYKKKNIYIIYWGDNLDTFLQKIGGEVDIDKLSVRDIYDRVERLRQIVDKHKYITPENFVTITTNLLGLWGGYNDILYQQHIGLTIHNKKLIKIYNSIKAFEKKSKSNIDEYFNYFSNLIQANIVIDSKVIGKYNETIIENYFIDFDYKSLEKQIKNTISENKQDDLLELKRAFFLYQNRKFIESYHILKNLSNRAFKNRNYIIWFICELNRKHFVFDSPFYPFGDDYETKNKELETYFRETRKINLQDLLLRLPKNDREILNPLADIESFLDKSLIKIMQLNDKIQQDYKIYKSGLFNINNHINQVLHICFGQLSLLINNYYLTLEHNSFIKDFYIKALESVLISCGIYCIRQERENKQQKAQGKKVEVSFGKIICYYIVRFYDYKELQKALNNYFDKQALFVFDNYEFISKLFKNICDKFDSPHNPYVNNFNTFLILNAFVKLRQNIFDEILNTCKDKMQNGFITLTEYDSINYFIVNQYNRNKKLNFDKTQEIIKTYINLFIAEKINFYHIASLTHSRIFENMFILLKDKHIFCDIEKERIDIFVKQISNKFDMKTQGAIATKFLLGICSLLKDNTAQTIIKNFLNSMLQAYKDKNEARITDSDYFLLCYLIIENGIDLVKKQDIKNKMDKYCRKNNSFIENANNHTKENMDIVQTLSIIEQIQEVWKKQDKDNKSTKD